MDLKKIGILLIIIIWSIISSTQNNLLYPSIIDVLIDIFNLLKDGNNLLIILFTFLALMQPFLCVRHFTRC